MASLRSVSVRSSPVGLTVLRGVVGAVMIIHGVDKLLGYRAWVGSVEQLGLPWPDVLAALAVVAEAGGGAGLLFGLLTPLAALGVLVNLVVAIALVHWESGFFARDGGVEYPLTLAAAAFFFLLRGGGPVALDALFFGRRGRHEAGRQRPLRQAAA